MTEIVPLPPDLPELPDGWVYLGLGPTERPHPRPPRFIGRLHIPGESEWSPPSHDLCGWGSHCHYACAVKDWNEELQRRFLPPIPLTLPLELIL